MRFETADSFKADYKRLSRTERALFSRAVKSITRAYADYVRNRAKWPPQWPKELRMQSVVDAKGIFEMTWSFSGPDGRATFEFVNINGEPAIRLRRIGDHAVVTSRNA